jgi:hypothetical protein
MKTNSKRKLLFTTIMFAALLISSAYAALIPKVDAAELPPQGLPVSPPEVDVSKSAIEEKGLSILSNVLSLDMEKYATASKEGPQDLYMDAIPEENVHYTLQSDDSKVDMLCTFAKGNLRMMNVLESEGAPHMTKLVTKPVDLGNATLQVIDLVGTAKGFLSDYQSYSEKAFYGELRSMLENVDADKNSTKTVGNVKLEVTVSEGSTVFRWTYTINGIDAPSKCVALGYKNGFFKYFIDNWDLYKIGSTAVNISVEEAIGIAMERARAFSWNMGSDNDTFKISGFKVANAMIWENVFCSNIYAEKARSEDPLMLYPMRHVWVSLDKFYPGNVYGFNVYVWADTGEVCDIHERVSTMDPPAELMATSNDFTIEPLSDQASVDETKSDSLSVGWIVLPVFAAVMLGTVPVWFLLSKKHNFPKRRVFKVGGVLLCLLISSMLLLPISAVSAYPTRRALIWGAESTGDTSYWNGTDWVTGRKTSAEIYRQQVSSNAISNYFEDDQYAVDNYQGDGSIKYCILDNITDAETNYSKVAVVDFDHGIGGNETYRGASGEWHFQFEDNVGIISGEEADPEDPDNWVNTHMVYDMDIYDETDEKTFFALINTCLSAYIDDELEAIYPDTTVYDTTQGLVNGRARGMPFAWTHRIVREKGPGFNTNDHMSSDGYANPDDGDFCYIGFPWGSAALDQTITGIAPKYATWLENFFWYALSFDISVNNALDEASLDNFEDLFGDTDLATGFSAVWPWWNGEEWDDTPWPGCTLVVYGNGNMRLYEYFVHDYLSATGTGIWEIDDPDNIEGGSNDGQYTRMFAYYFPWIGNSQALLRCSIGWEATGHIYLYGYATTTSYLQVWVSYDDSNWNQVDSFTVYQGSPQWIDVGSYANKFRYIAIVVYPQGVVYLDSVLIIPQPQQSGHYWVPSITDYSWYGSSAGVANPNYLIGSFNDGQYTHLHAGEYQDQAMIVGAMNAEAHGHIELYGYSGAGYTSHLYVYVSYDNINWDPVRDFYVSQSSPHWIDCWTWSSNFRYIAIVVYRDAGYSAYLYVDSVKVTP